MSRILHLTLKKKWFDMIASGEKKEEFREIKEYWIRRLFVNYREYFELLKGNKVSSQYGYIVFRSGYKKDAPEMEVEFIDIRIEENGNRESGWNEKCFAIKLGKILSIKNYKQ